MTLLAIMLGCATVAAAPLQEAKPATLRVYVGAYANGPGRDCTGARKLQQPASSYAYHDLPPCSATDAFRFL